MNKGQIYEISYQTDNLRRKLSFDFNICGIRLIPQ